MQLNQIAQLLNETMVPNILGEGTTISEDLSNFADLGTAVSNLTAEQMKDYTAGFIANVIKTYYDERIFNKTVPGLFRDYEEWGGIIQRVKAGLSQVTDDVSQNLQNGVSYDPFVYVGFQHDNIVYTQDCTFELDWSIPDNMYKTAFSSVAELQNFISYIYNRAENTMNVNLYASAMATLRALILANTSKVIHLLTLYNTTHFDSSSDYLTADEALENAAFCKWYNRQILLLKKAVTDVSTKYNDGSIETFTPAEDVNVIQLAQVALAVEMNMTSGVYHKDLVEIGNYSEVNFWQNSDDDLIPALSIAGQVKGAVGGGEVTTVGPVAFVIADKYSCGITSHPEVVTSMYNGKGRFTNFFRSIWAQFYVAKNQNCIIGCLD